jgi:lysozyme family protein
MPTLQDTTVSYAKLWDSANISKSAADEAARVAQRIVKNRETYEGVEKATGVPWFWVGAVHNRESGLDFKTHLHCGDPLTARTYHEPKGRPVKGNPPFTFQESAVDAVTMPPHSLADVKRWSVERMCYEQERYNGWGYIRKHENSPYVWAGTSAQQSGKYVADGKYDGNAWDRQLGTVVVMKAVADIDADARARLQDREANPPAEVVKHETRREKSTTAAAGTAAGTTAGTTAATEQPHDQPSFIAPVVGYTVAGLCIAVAVVAAVLWRRKLSIITSKWGTPS